MPDEERKRVSGYGIASAVLGVLAIVGVVLSVMIWTQHREQTAELRYRTQVLQAAADWTGVLINMNSDTVESDLATLHEGTVGQLNADFDATVEPYRRLVQTLRARTTGQIDSVALETIHPDRSAAPGPAPQPELAEVAARTDIVIVVATSVSENAGGQDRQTVRWTLRLDVSDVDGRLLVSRLEPIR